MSDYELGIDVAVGEVFPEAKHSGCWFHFCKVRQKTLVLCISTYFNDSKVTSVL